MEPREELQNAGSAVVVVACVAGFGAWGASVTVSPNPVYASELFGAGHAAITYPDKMTPRVTLTMSPVDVTLPARAAAGADTDDTADDRDACAAFEVEGSEDDSGSAEVTFTLLAGMFDGNVKGLMWESIDGTSEAAPASVATIESGGRKGDNAITISVKAATTDATTRSTDAGTAPTAYPDEKACRTIGQDKIYFDLPKLTGLQALAGANITDDKKDNDEKTVYARAESRVVSGAFTDGFITGGAPHFVASVVKARDSVTLKIEASDKGMKTIALKDDSAKGLTAFKSVKEKNKDGYVELATVTVTTKQMAAEAVKKADAMHQFNLDTSTEQDGSALQKISTTPVKKKDATFHELYDLDGGPIDEGLRGTLTVDAMGTRDLFNEDDMLFIDYDKNGKMGSGEAIAIDGNMGMGDALSVDPDKSDSFDKGGTGTFKVYYMPGGKGDINHGAMINLTAMVDYSDPTAIDEAPKKSSTTLNFDGVTSEVDAYAIPQSGNGKGDMANVRVRCEAANGCRVFLECWDDMGMRSFGEAGMIAANALAKWDSMAIEGVIGVEDAMSRHSCRILSAGMVKVQQLTRDGSSGTLVNNTYIGE